jgi:hypothetical protein
MYSMRFLVCTVVLYAQGVHEYMYSVKCVVLYAQGVHVQFRLCVYLCACVRVRVCVCVCVCDWQ